MFEGPETVERHHHTGHRWLDFVLAGSALLVSVVSLTVAIMHGRTMEAMADANARLVQANSWPFLTTILSRGKDEVVLGLRDTGVGPAKIHWVQMSYAGRPMRSTYDLMAACCGYDAKSSGAAHHLDYSYSIIDNTVLRAGDPSEIITLKSLNNPVVFPAFHDRFFKVHIRNCYCSVFDECFIGDGQSLDPKPVKTCPAPDTPFDPKP